MATLERRVMVMKWWGWLLATPGALLWLAKTALFIIGASTAPEDFTLLLQKLGGAAAFVQRQPGWEHYLITTAMILGFALIVRGRRTSHPDATSVAPSTTTPGPTITSHNQSGGITAHTVNREDKHV